MVYALAEVQKRASLTTIIQAVLTRKQKRTTRVAIPVAKKMGRSGAWAKMIPAQIKLIAAMIIIVMNATKILLKRKAYYYEEKNLNNKYCVISIDRLFW